MRTLTLLKTQSLAFFFCGKNASAEKVPQFPQKGPRKTRGSSKFWYCHQETLGNNCLNKFTPFLFLRLFQVLRRMEASQISKREIKREY